MSAKTAGTLSTPHRLILRAALLTRDPALAAWRNWHAEMGEAADSETDSLLPAIAFKFQPVEADVPGKSRLMSAYRRTLETNQLALRELCQIIDGLGQDGIAPLVLGDAWLGVQYFETVGIRPIGRLELVVPPSLAVTALANLRANGCRSLLPTTRTFGHAWVSSQVFQTPQRRTLELHWHILPEWPDDPADGEFAMRAISTSNPEAPLTGMDATATLLLAAAGELRHLGRLRCLADIASILQSEELIEWPSVPALARRFHLVVALRHALEILRNEVGLEIRASALNQLQAMKLSATERLEARVLQNIGGERNASAILWEHAAQCSRIVSNRGIVGGTVALWDLLRNVWNVRRSREIPGAAASRLFPSPASEHGRH